MQIIMIQGKLPSLNEYVRICRGNRYYAGKKVKEIEQGIILQLSKLKPISQPVYIGFEWHEANQRRDKDNIAFAKKFVLDALQYAGKLPNYNNKYLLGFTDGFVYGKEYGVKLYIVSENERFKSV